MLFTRQVVESLSVARVLTVRPNSYSAVPTVPIQRSTWCRSMGRVTPPFPSTWSWNWRMSNRAPICQPAWSSRMSLAQITMTVRDRRKMIAAAALTSGVIPRRSNPQI